MHRRLIAITAGEPAGIGPELVALVAMRHRENAYPARLVVIGDRVEIHAVGNLEVA